MKVSDFDYYLPEELIAQEPAADRASSRLLVLEKSSRKITHTTFENFIDYLKPGDCMVINNTKVIPARLNGHKTTGTKVEILLLKEKSSSANTATWEALVRPGKRLKNGDIIRFDKAKLTAEIIDTTERGSRIINLKSPQDIKKAMYENGQMPLPPYIKKSLADPTRYQTVYCEKEGSVAAPTAGLHFTPEILAKVKRSGVKIAKVSLEIGLDTFRPVKVEDVENHKMHSENIEVGEQTAKVINKTKKAGGRIIAIGTTVVRTLESCATEGNIAPYHGNTQLFIYPGYNFKITDLMLTNFHLPRSTLLMMISAFAGYDNIMNAYKEAIRHKYRFFSFGDAMLII